MPQLLSLCLTMKIPSDATMILHATLRPYAERDSEKERLTTKKLPSKHLSESEHQYWQAGSLLYPRAHVCAHLPLEVQQSEGLELDGSFGSQIPGQGPGKVFKFLNSVCDASLQPRV